MNSPRNLTLVPLLAAVGAASAQEVTRTQVNSEVAGAMRNGDIVSAQVQADLAGACTASSRARAAVSTPC
jgi:hypothetical protein